MIPRDPWPRPSEATVERLRIALERALGPSKVISHPAGCERYAADESDQAPVVPDAVVLAACADDVARCLAVAGELGVPVTPRAGGTGKSGGAVPVCGGVVLCTLGMADIAQIDAAEQIAVVGPGVILADLHRAVEARGLFYPPDPNSLDSCALGGNIAENAGGPRAFKYGVTRDYVLGLRVVTADGQLLELGRRTKKGVTGYDLTALLTGSEGTLAVIVGASLRLLRKPPQVATLLGVFDQLDDAAAAVSAVVAAGLVPRCLELIDSSCVAAMRADGVAIDARAGALLITEVDGEPEACERQMAALGERLVDGGAREVLVAQDAAQRDRLWSARRQMSEAVRKLAPHKISEDVVVPRGRIAELVRAVQQIAERTEIRMLSYGHAGDGNLHVSFLFDSLVDIAAVELGLRELFAAVVDMGGSLSGEHGIGSCKAQFLPLEQAAPLIDLQRRLKRLFDPRGILNPGKIFPREGHGSC